MSMMNRASTRWVGLLLACALSLACGPTEEESSNDATWLILSVSTYDEDSSQGILQLQAQGGQAVQLRLNGGTIRDELGEAADPLCVGVRDGAVRRLPFSLEGMSGTLTAVLLGSAEGAPADAGPCAGTDPIPLESACCILPNDCGCDGETGGGGDDGEGSSSGASSSSTGADTSTSSGPDGATSTTEGSTTTEGTTTTGTGGSTGATR